MTPGRKWALGGGIFAAFVIAVNIAPAAPETPRTYRPPKTVVTIETPGTPTPRPSPVAAKPTETPIAIIPEPDAGKRILDRVYNPPKTSTSVHAGSSNGPTYGNNFAEPSVREFGNQSGLSWVDVYTFQDANVNRPKTWTDVQKAADH